MPNQDTEDNGPGNRRVLLASVWQILTQKILCRRLLEYRILTEKPSADCYSLMRWLQDTETPWVGLGVPVPIVAAAINEIQPDNESVNIDCQ
ncbi:MAG: hypothetical protein M1838_003311, partial [Thelocarpon superellum]